MVPGSRLRESRFSWKMPRLERTSSSRVPPASTALAKSSMVTSPATRLLPRVAKPNRLDSSPTKQTLSSGTGTGTPLSLMVRIASSAPMTPTGPSYRPPWTTESRCDPASTAGPSRAPASRPKMLPAASTWTSRPAWFIRWPSNWRDRSSCTENTSRVTEPPSPRPMRETALRSRNSLSLLISGTFHPTTRPAGKGRNGIRNGRRGTTAGKAPPAVLSRLS